MKSQAGKRGIGLPDELVALLKHHRKEQERERLTVSDLWQETSYVFTTPTGGPLNPRTDYTEWKRLLERAGCRNVGYTMHATRRPRLPVCRSPTGR
jgi:integrase